MGGVLRWGCVSLAASVHAVVVAVAAMLCKMHTAGRSKMRKTL